MEASETVKRMYDALSCIPPDFATTKMLFAEYQPSEEELMWLAVELTENTFGEYGDMLNEKCLSVMPGKVHRDHLYDTILFLLNHGLNPNTIVDEGTTESENVMPELRFTDGPDVAARTMRLLLEHGGNPNLDTGALTAMIWLEMELHVDPIWERIYCDNLVQCLMVMQAYGGHFYDDTVPIAMREGYSSELFKEFEKFDYYFVEDEDDPSSIHIFEKATGKVVADYL